jgi:hypothetical protein
VSAFVDTDILVYAEDFGAPPMTIDELAGAGQELATKGRRSRHITIRL